jgi:hypothetical protein
MRDLNVHNAHRVDMTDTHGWSGDGTCGMFAFPSPIDGQALRVQASSTDGWDHVSVSRKSRPPNWVEMEFIKRKFFEDTECAVEFHVPPDQHINCHKYCLHLWRSQTQPFPMPPWWMIGPKPKGTGEKHG